MNDSHKLSSLIDGARSLLFGCFWKRVVTFSTVLAAIVTVLAGFSGAWSNVEPVWPASRGYVNEKVSVAEEHAAMLARQVQIDQKVVNGQVLDAIGSTRLELARSSKRDADFRKLQLEKEQALETDPVRRAANQHEIDGYTATIADLNRFIEALERPNTVLNK